MYVQHLKAVYSNIHMLYMTPTYDATQKLDIQHLDIGCLNNVQKFDIPFGKQ